MDTYAFIKSDWTQKMAEFDTMFSDYGLEEEWDLWRENPQAREFTGSSGQCVQEALPLNLDIEKLISTLRKPLLAMASGEKEFNPVEFQRTTNEIKFLEWVAAEVDKQDYFDSFQTLHQESISVTEKVAALEQEKTRLEDEIELKKKRITEIDKICIEANRFQAGFAKFDELKSRIAKHIAMILIVDLWRSDKNEVRDRYLSLPANAIEVAEFILLNFLNYNPQRILELRRRKIEQDS